MEKSNKITCTLCNSDNLSSLGNIINGQFSHDFLKKFSLFNCKKCSFKFINPTPSDNELNYIYSSQDYSQWEVADETSKADSSRYLNFEYYADNIKKIIKEGKILDCGCATGLFLDIMKKIGFDCFGVEISEIPFFIAEKNHRGKIFRSKIEELNIQNGFFDIITMFDLIEHVSDPRQILQKANSLLSDGGMIFITTPNTNSLSATLMGKRHNDFIIEHLSLFNKNNLTRLLKESGFEVIKIQPAKKIISLKFAEKVFTRHTNPIAYPIRLANKFLPDKISQMPIKLFFGGMFVVAQKIN